MSKYGEPWSAARVGENVCDIHEDQKPGCPTLIAEDVDGDHADRIVRCVNALSGLNPEAVREVVEKAERYFSLCKGNDVRAMAVACDDLEAALAKVRES